MVVTNTTPPGIFKCKLDLEYFHGNLSETYWLNSGDAESAKETSSILVELRRYWLANGCQIKRATAMDASGKHIWRNVPGLPLASGYPLSTNYDALNDPDVAFQYVLQHPIQRTITHWLRLVPDSWVVNFRPAITIPRGIRDAAGTIQDLKLMPYNGYLNYVATLAYPLTLNVFLNFLVFETRLVHFDREAKLYTREESRFTDIYFRRVAKRRTGRVTGSPQGRFSK